MRAFYFLAALLFASNAYADGAPEIPKLVLSAQGEVKAVPDQATLTLSVVTQKRQASEALQQNAKEMSDAVAALKAAGIETKDIQTSSVSIQPQYTYATNIPRRLTGYEARNTITVTIRKIEKTGDILDKVVTLGINEVNGPYFGLADKSKAQDEARKQAMDKVRKLAALYEDGMGLKLGRIMQVNESSSMPMPQMEMARGLMAAEAKAASTPVEAGELNVTAQVTVVWEILP